MITFGSTYRKGVLKLLPRLALLTSIVLALSLSISASAFAQGPTTTNFGVGRGHGLEFGINMDTINALRAEINAGLYDRPCAPEEHDRTKWHSLVNIERKCHYDHMHGDDPNYVNDIFGEPGGWFGSSGQSISYPWQTFKAATANEQNTAYVAAGQMENDLKHEGYIWVVRRDQPCPNGNCTTDFRLETHAIMGAHDMPVRYHSFSLEARVCADAANPSTCGILRYGGWIDMGRLFVTQPGVIDCGHAVEEVFITLAADTLYRPIERPEARDEIRCHPTINRLPAYPSNRPLAEWWGHAGGETRFQLKSFDPIGNVDTADPNRWQFFCTLQDLNCRYDASIWSAFIGYTLQIPEFVGQVNGRFVRTDSNGDRRTDLTNAYFTRWGSLNSACTGPALDCVPYKYDNAVLNLFDGKEARYNHSPCDSCPKFDHDISPPGQKWITWFFRYAQGGHHTPTPGTPVPPTTPPPTVPGQPTMTPVTPTSTPPPGQPTTPPPPGPTSLPPGGTPPAIPTDPSVIVYVNPVNAAAGQQIDVMIGVANVTNLFGLQTQCTVDPSVLVGVSRADGTVFSTSNSFFVDTGFNATTGKWVIAAARLLPNPAFTGQGMAYKMTFRVQNAVPSPVNCTALAVDSNGRILSLGLVTNGGFVGGQQVVQQPPLQGRDPMAATLEPGVVLNPTEPVVLLPTDEVVVVPTEPVEVLPTTMPTEEPVVLPPGDPTTTLTVISGIVGYQNHADNAGITVQLVTPDSVLATLTTTADGKFSFTDVPMGTYGITATAAQHLRIGKVVQVTADGMVIDLGTLVLPAGDTDNNGTVDLSDAGLVGANFNVAVPPAPTSADLNGDGSVDVRDLVLIGSNFGLVAPIVLQ